MYVVVHKRAVEDRWVKHLSNHLVCMLVCMACIRVCVCVYVCTNVYGVYTYGAHMILSMSMVHIYMCSGTQTHTTSMHTKWFDKCLTPRAVEELWVKHLSNHLVCMLVCRACMHVCACANVFVCMLVSIECMRLCA